jgi:signal peptidase complex subunit 1
MDFEGQKRAEYLLVRIILAFATAGFLVGYVLGSFQLMAIINAVGLGFTLLVVVPNWWFYNHDALEWLPPLKGDAQAAVVITKKPAKR